MNRPEPVKSDNFFVMLFHALRLRRVPISLRIAFHSVLLVAAAMVIYALVMGLQFKQAMQQQADALGQSLLLQTRESASQLLVSNDILSLNVLLNNLVKNKLVAHAAVYGVGSDSRILAEAGTRPDQNMLGETRGQYSADITFQEVIAGHLRISLDMRQFQQPMTISLQSMGILSLILLVLALALSMRLGRHISLPLRQLRLWVRDPDDPAPAYQRQDEIGDLARQLQARLVPEPPVKAAPVEPAPITTAPTPTYKTPEPVAYEPQEPFIADDWQEDERLEPHFELPDAPLSAAVALADEEAFDDSAFTDIQEPVVAQAPVAAARKSAVLAIQLGAQEQLRRLPRTRLLELLQRYRDCLEQAAHLYQAELHTLKDGSSLMLFHQQDNPDEYLIHAVCCGELMRALGHALQIEVADSGITLQLQLGLGQGEGLHGLNQGEILLSETTQYALAISQHSRNLLLLESSISQESQLRECARIRSIASPEGASCVERLLDPYPSLVERQLLLMNDH